jgi:dephospho-CoA kinase
VVEIPLLFEKKLEKNFDRVVVCSCNIQLALLRWEARGGRKEEYEALAGLLMPLESKLKRADFIVENDSTLPTLQNAVQLIHTQLLNQSQYV